MVNEFVNKAPQNIKSRLVEKTVKKGEDIIFEGSKDNCIYLLTTGRVLQEVKNFKNINWVNNVQYGKEFTKTS